MKVCETETNMSVRLSPIRKNRLSSRKFKNIICRKTSQLSTCHKKSKMKKDGKQNEQYEQLKGNRTSEKNGKNEAIEKPRRYKRQKKEKSVDLNNDDKNKSINLKKNEENSYSYTPYVVNFAKGHNYNTDLNIYNNNNNNNYEKSLEISNESYSFIPNKTYNTIQNNNLKSEKKLLKNFNMLPVNENSSFTALFDDNNNNNEMDNDEFFMCFPGEAGNSNDTRLIPQSSFIMDSSLENYSINSTIKSSSQLGLEFELEKEFEPIHNNYNTNPYDYSHSSNYSHNLFNSSMNKSMMNTTSLNDTSLISKSVLNTHILNPDQTQRSIIDYNKISNYSSNHYINANPDVNSNTHINSNPNYSYNNNHQYTNDDPSFEIIPSSDGIILNSDSSNTLNF